jgi:O-succinylbenzoic acid--CoA ligase
LDVHMQDWLAASAAANPHKIALVADKRAWTYADLHEEVAGVCVRLRNAGVKSGDHVGVLLPNGVEYVLLIHALARLGALLVPLNVRLTADELTWQAAWADCAAVICNGATAEKTQGIASAQVIIIWADDVCDTTGRGGSRTAPTQPHTVTTSDSKNGIDLNRAQAIVFTSGTTGKPKGAQITFGNHFWSAVASSWRLGTLPEDRWLLTLPLYHVGGLAIVLRCCLYGTTVVLLDRFEPDALLDALERHSITLVSLVPTMLYRLLELNRSFPSSLRLILLGGAAASPELVERCAERGVPVATTYGLTEAASQVATMLPDEVRKKPGSVGKPLMFTNVRITDEQGKSLPAGEYGEVVVSGRTVMKGYYKQPDDPALRDGELYTGDIGYLDADGDLWLVQRRSDLIVSGGENVYPAEVENVLIQHPSVAAVCIVGLPSDEWGQQVAAAVVLKPGSSANEGELQSFCRPHLAGYKCPRKIAFLSELPLTASGKVSRKLVTEMLGSA